MKRLEFLKRLGMGAAAVVAAPTIIANTKILPIKENIGEVLEFPDGTKEYHRLDTWKGVGKSHISGLEMVRPEVSAELVRAYGMNNIK